MLQSLHITKRRFTKIKEEQKICNENAPVYYTYKDRVFRLLFREKKRLLELYNALNGTAYANEEELTVNTLENAIFIKMKNDVSFIIDCNMCLYEHQSTYFSRIFRKLLRMTAEDA